jgi:type VI protein secretion system component VasK
LADFEFAHIATLAAVAGALEASASSPAILQVTAQASVTALLTRLRSLLDDHDTAAVDCLNSLRQVLEEKSSAFDPLQRLELSIGAYDFEQARRELETLTQALAPRALETEPP